MRVSDYMVDLLIKYGCHDIFGYQGGMISHFVNSLAARSEITPHLNYHEQAAAFAACGYAQAGGNIGVVYSSSGPGATNLITGICHAYYDSVPVIFITGQVNTFESKGSLKVRQKAFQETDIIDLVKGVVKAAFYVDDKDDIKYYFERAFYIAKEGRPGPVLLDIPLNIQRMEVEPSQLKGFELPRKQKFFEQKVLDLITEKIQKSKRPCILLGAGIKSNHLEREVADIVEALNIPTVTSMIAFDILPWNSPVNYGFIGAYGKRYANFILSKCDLLITIGSRLDVRQIGAKKENFAPQAELIRFDIDENELENKIKENEYQILCDLTEVVSMLKQISLQSEKFSEWRNVCDVIKEELIALDHQKPNAFIKHVSQVMPNDWCITTDVGQNQVWAAQDLLVNGNQRVLFSGGHGAMGYSLPAAIGAAVRTRKGVICFTGDGGMQMNIQELQTVFSEKLPIKIFVLNNRSLGMIRHFQEMYLNGEYIQTVEGRGYSTPDFCKIAQAYGISATAIEWDNDLREVKWDSKPELIEVRLSDRTYAFPKLEFGKPNQDQEPLLDRALYNFLLSL